MTTTTSSISSRQFARTLPPTVSAKAVQGGLLNLLAANPSFLREPKLQAQLQAFCKKHGLQDFAKKNPLTADDLQGILAKMADKSGNIDKNELFAFVDTLDTDRRADSFSKDGVAGKLYSTLTGVQHKELENDKTREFRDPGHIAYRNANNPLKKLESNEDFIALGSSKQGKAIQKLLILAAAQGKNVLPLLEEKDPKRMMHQAMMAVSSNSFQPGNAEVYESKRRRLETCLKELQAVNDPSQLAKSGAAIGLTNALKEDPSLFQMLDPKSQKIVAALLLERMGHTSPNSTEGQNIKAALASLKKDNPETYKAVFSEAKKAMEDPKLWANFTKTLMEDGKFSLPATGLSTAWAARLGKIAENGKFAGADKAGLLGAVGVVGDTVRALTSGKGASTVSADILNSFLSFGMGLAVSVGVSATAGGLIGAVPTFLLAKWKAAVETNVTQKAIEQTREQLKDPSVSVE